MKDTYMQFSEAPSYFLRRRPKYIFFLTALFLNTVCPYSSLIRETKFHAHTKQQQNYGCIFLYCFCFR